MRKSLRVAGAALGLVLIAFAVLFAIGEFLPSAHSVTLERILPLPPERVWQLVRDFEGSAAWRTDVESTRALAPDARGVVYVDTTAMGELRYLVEAETPPTRLVTRIVDEPAFGGTWTYTLGATPAGGTRLAITEDGVVHSRVFRVLGRFVFGHEATLRTYLDDLERRCAAP